MQVVDNNGNIFGGGLQVNGPDGKPKTSSGGGTPSGPAGGDLSGSYPNPGVVWSNGTPTYDLQYYPLSLNPAGYLTSAALSGYLTAATAASTYYPLTNPNGFISGITGSDVVTALGFTPYDAANPAGYIDSSALGPYLTAATAATTYQTTLVSGTNIKTINGASVLGSGDLSVSSAASWGGITGTLSSQSDLQSALNAKQDTLVSGTNIKTIASNSLVGSGDVPLKTINGIGLVGSSNIVIASSPYTLIGNQTGAYITGTTANSPSCSQQIFANTVSSTNIIQVRTKVYKVTSTTSTTVRMYLNTTNSLTGATLIATGGAMATLGMQSFWRDFLLVGTSLYCYNPSNAISSDITFSFVTLVTFNPAVDNFIIFAVQNSATADSVSFLRTSVMKYA